MIPKFSIFLLLCFSVSHCLIQKIVIGNFSNIDAEDKYYWKLNRMRLVPSSRGYLIGGGILRDKQYNEEFVFQKLRDGESEWGFSISQLGQNIVKSIGSVIYSSGQESYYFVGSLAESSISSDLKPMIGKISNDGTIEFIKTLEIGKGKFGFFDSIIEGSDGLLVTGLCEANTDNFHRLPTVAKFNFDGELEWMKVAADSMNMDSFYNIQKTADNGYLVDGFITGDSVSPLKYRGLIIGKYDKDFNLEWMKDFRSHQGIDKQLYPCDEKGSSTTTDNYYVVCGKSAAGELVLAAFDKVSGDLEWAKSFGFDDHSTLLIPTKIIRERSITTNVKGITIFGGGKTYSSYILTVSETGAIKKFKTFKKADGKNDVIFDLVYVPSEPLIGFRSQRFSSQVASFSQHFGFVKTDKDFNSCVDFLEETNCDEGMLTSIYISENTYWGELSNPSETLSIVERGKTSKQLIFQKIDDICQESNASKLISSISILLAILIFLL